MGILMRSIAGSLVFDENLSVSISLTEASRAVWSAGGRNSIPTMNSCHWVIRKCGEFGDYHWEAVR